MTNNKVINFGIGFATGRKGFQQVLKTYVYSCDEDGLVRDNHYSLNVFVAYDLKYNKTKVSDYTDVSSDVLDKLDSIEFIDSNNMEKEIEYLTRNNVITRSQGKALFGSGYAAKRNAILYRAIKLKMDYLIFLDDDEYPMAVTNTKKSAIWGGQHALATHLEFIKSADITHGHHCGYISPIPFIEFNEKMSEEDFKIFIEAISNDIINWEKIMKVMSDGGVTYADTNIIKSKTADEILENKGTKFISGANLCINLKIPNRVYPFYNPPNARGEDTFLSTCLSERKVISVPCYTFHDGFSTYNRLLEGVLPTKLSYAVADSKTVERFYKACVGWVRYKPLLLYITDPEKYEEKLIEMNEKLIFTLPKIAAYFSKKEFMNILDELDFYRKNIEPHREEFEENKLAWGKIMEHFTKINNS